MTGAAMIKELSWSNMGWLIWYARLVPVLGDGGLNAKATSGLLSKLKGQVANTGQTRFVITAVKALNETRAIDDLVRIALQLKFETDLSNAAIGAIAGIDSPITTKALLALLDKLPPEYGTGIPLNNLLDGLVTRSTREPAARDLIVDSITRRIKGGLRPDQRVKLAQTLGRIGGDPARAALRDVASGDRDPKVKSEAQKSLEGLGRGR